VRTLLLYDSIYGNTRQLARTISAELGEHSSVQVVPLSQADGLEIADADLLIVGGPTQRHNLTPTVRAWLAALPYGVLDGMPASVFDTRLHQPGIITGSAAQVIARELKRRGATLVMPPESFFVTHREGPLMSGEFARAVDWAHEVAVRARDLIALARI
jgi:flavodoxin